MHRTAFTRLSGLTVHFRQEGPEGAPALVFINSLGCDLRIWDAVVPEFTSRFRVLRYDKRGHGLSDAPTGPYSIGQLAGDLLRLLNHVDIQEATLIGISVGGQIALEFAVRYPEQVNALVLCDTAPKLGTRADWDERIAAVEKNGLEQMAEAILARWFAPGFASRRPAAYRGYANMLGRMPVHGYTATCAALREADLRQSLDAVQRKSLVICGEEDRAVSPEVCRQLAETLGPAAFKLIPGSGHLPCIEQPAALAEAIDLFLVGGVDV